MPLSALHTIELQLCMQHCDKHTLLSLARCSRTTLAAASCDFSFRFVSPVLVPLRAELAPLASRSLLRFCDVSLVQPVSDPSTAAESVRRRWSVEAVSFQRVRQLELLSAVMSAEWSELLVHPRMSGLTALSAPGKSFEESHMRLLLRHQAGLRTLRFSSAVSSEVSALLCALPSLTDVSVGLVPIWMSKDAQTRTLDHLALCTSVRRLSLSAWSPAAVDRLLKRVEWSSRLEDLSLVNCFLDASACAFAHWSPSLSCLSSLRRLLLDRCQHLMDLIECALASCRSLELIVLRPSPSQWSHYWANPRFAVKWLPNAPWIQQHQLTERPRTTQDDGPCAPAAPLTLELWAAGPALNGPVPDDRPVSIPADALAQLRSAYATVLTPAALAHAQPAMRFELVEYRSSDDWKRPLLDVFLVRA